MTDRKDSQNQNDSYANVFTQLGLRGGDKSTGTFFAPDRVLSYEELSNMYANEAVAARIVDRVVDDSIRTGFTLMGADKAVDLASVKSELEDLGALSQIGDAWRWARLYGGALLIMAVNDGRPLDQPLDLANAKKLSALTVVDNVYVIPDAFSPGLGSRSFANPEYYNVTVNFGAGGMRKIHKSRVIRFDSYKVPASQVMRYGGWSPSIIQRCWQEVKRLGSAMGYAESLLHEISIMVLGITDLRDKLCGGPGNVSQIKDMLRTLKWGMDNEHILALDKEDSFNEVKRSVDGVDRLIDKFVDAVVRASNMPRLVILGESPPGGLNPSSDGETRTWYDAVATERDIHITPALNRILTVLMACRKNRGETVPDEWTIKYQSLAQQSPEKEADTLLKLTQSLTMLIQNDVVSSDEVRAMLVDRGYVVPLEGEDSPSDPLELT